ncbi:MAG: DUF3179 domain-containing protein [Planctomycetota bacterium]
MSTKSITIPVILLCVIAVVVSSIVGLKWSDALAEEQTATLETKGAVEKAEVAYTAAPPPANGEDEWAAPERFLDLLSGRGEKIKPAIAEIDRKWHPGNVAPLIEVLRFTNDLRVQHEVVDVLRKHTGQRLDAKIDDWYHWLWSQEYQPHPKYAQFKALLYEDVDRRFREYFQDTDGATIRLDEIRWGGVVRDGIPPLKDPEVLSVKDANYLADSDVVFGVEFNGQARAYPKRILAWHEMVKDTVGGQTINGVYCTLCGSMIVYDPNFDGKHYELGTSGFLYRSNKLMYDHATKSMWSTIEGKPVVGPLASKGIQLKPLHVVTSTWGEWRRRHPETTVLSLKTGHRRDYGEGVAYKRYFGTDELMFTVPKLDGRLKNKDEVFVVRNEQAKTPVAIAAQFLAKHPVYHDRVGEQSFVVITDSSGANRAYDSGEHKLERLGEQGDVVDSTGATWAITEDALVLNDGDARLSRLPAHRAFWFGWFSVHENTRLVK